MRAVIQRVDRATVLVSGETVGTCEKGFLILLGIGKEDTEQSAKLLAEKVSKLRVFSDAAGKMNRSLLDLDYSVLLISQFTLYADTSHGNRPSFFLIPHRRNLQSRCIFSSESFWKRRGCGWNTADSVRI